jgi:hypothetical protein
MIDTRGEVARKSLFKLQEQGGDGIIPDAVVAARRPAVPAATTVLRSHNRAACPVFIEYTETFAPCMLWYSESGL